MSLHTESFNSAQQLFSYAAQHFVERLQHTVARKQFFDVALSGGTTARDFFTVLRSTLADNLHRDRIRFFFSDERAVPINSPDSNAGVAFTTLFKPLGIASSQIFPMYTATKTAQSAAQSYESLLRRTLDKSPHNTGVFDLIYLGVGSDGHTASLFPHSTLLENNDSASSSWVASCHVATAAHERITLMPQIIHHAREVCVLASGNKKAAVIDSILSDPIDPQRLPAQLVLRDPPNAVLLLTDF